MAYQIFIVILNTPPTVSISVTQRQSVGFGAEMSRVRNSLGFGSTVFPLGKENNRHCKVLQFARNAHWAEPSPLFAHRAHPSPLNCRKGFFVRVQ